MSGGAMTRTLAGAKRRKLLAPVIGVVLCAVHYLFCPTPPAHAAIVWSGDVSPADPTTWTILTKGYIGRDSSGTVTVDNASGLFSSDGYLGYNSGSTGTVTIAGTGSKWSGSLSLYVGYSGNGTLNVEAGGKVSNSYGYLGNNSGSSGTATITGTGSTWTNSDSLLVGCSGSGTLTVADGGMVTAGTLCASLSDLLGNGTITAKGAVLDTDLIIDAAHGLQQTFAFGTGGALNLNLDGSGDLGAGYHGAGTLRIADGVAITSSVGYLGYQSGSTGTATVTGAGSKWNTSDLSVGVYGSGTLNVEAGAQVSSRYYCYLGCNSGSTGTATVTGAGSTWNNSGDLCVGYSGSGTLTVADGGTVTAQTLYASLSNLLGNGTITAKGAVLDADIVFDAIHGPQPAVAFGTGGTLNLSPDGSGTLGAGYQSAGTLRIADGVAVTSYVGYLGYNSGSIGTAVVTGAGSTWINNRDLYIGRVGSGTLNIEAGGQVSNSTGYLSSGSGSSGTATVTGAGSTWNNSGDLYVGYVGSGTLTIADGGVVTAGTLFASLSNLLGNGTVTTKGAVLDADLVFDGTHGPQQTIAFGTGGTLSLNLDGSGDLGAGYQSTGTLRIAEGWRSHLPWATSATSPVPAARPRLAAQARSGPTAPLSCRQIWQWHAEH